MNRNYKMKKTISVKQFVEEFGETFSEYIKKRLLELEVRSVLTRKEHACVLDIRHVEHLQHEVPCEDNEEVCTKENTFGQFIVTDGKLYFSESCIENDNVMKSHIVSEIYSSLDSDEMICYEGINAKLIDDRNIDYIINAILAECPEVSQSYLDIMSEMNLRAKSKSQRISFT